MLEHFKFLKAHTRVMPKMCIPSPATLHFRLEPNAVDTKVYADRDAIFDDLGKTYQQAIRASTTPAAAICSSTTPPGLICARRPS